MKKIVFALFASFVCACVPARSPREHAFFVHCSEGVRCFKSAELACYGDSWEAIPESKEMSFPAIIQEAPTSYRMLVVCR